MYTHPSIVSQLAREHHRQMLAAASRRQLRRGQGRQATGTANGAGTIIRRAAMAIAGAGLAAVRGSATEHDVAAGDGEASGRPRATAEKSGWQTDLSGTRMRPLDLIWAFMRLARIR
jgi:hypothetical protein